MVDTCISYSSSSVSGSLAVISWGKEEGASVLGPGGPRTNVDVGTLEVLVLHPLMIGFYVLSSVAEECISQ